jgi:hypothetical protein
LRSIRRILAVATMRPLPRRQCGVHPNLPKPKCAGAVYRPANRCGLLRTCLQTFEGRACRQAPTGAVTSDASRARRYSAMNSP